ncbi:MAG: hypothetical protein APF76_03035 [Desulfitibacter sp. BRH_c19]|nr:MAG: hypothetical protein APF76_03035 [Desulfitibacter sp. BRH_c19]
MKKMIAIVALSLGIFYLSAPALAENKVSNIATEKGGLKVAQMAKHHGGLQHLVAQNIDGECVH